MSRKKNRGKKAVKMQDASDLESVDTVGEESTHSFGNLLDSDTMGLGMIGTQRPIKITPEKEVTVSIGFKEEVDLNRVLEKAKPDNYEKLVLVIHSPGGNVRSSYKVAKLIREKFSQIRVFVPHLALSGGTLIALAGNEIIMGDISNLTPIDVQRPYQGEKRSVNSMIRAFNTITNYFTKRSKEEAQYSWISLLNKLDPVVYQDWFDTRKLMEMYAVDILSHKDAEFEENEARNIVSRLLKTYPSHNYALMKEEFHDIIKEISGKTVVKDCSEYPQLWNAAENLLEEYRNAKAIRHVFRYILPEEEGDEKGNEKGIGGNS